MTAHAPAGGVALRALRRVGVDLRSDEAGLALTFFLYSFLLGIFQSASKSVRQASYVDSLGAAWLPLAYLLVGIVAYPVIRLYGRLAVRVSRALVVNVTVLGSAGTLVVFYALMASPGKLVSLGFYLFISIVTVLVLTQLWSYVNSMFDVRQARRLFGFVGSGALLGWVVGGQLARLAGRTDSRLALLAGAGALALIAVLVTLVEWRSGARVSLSGRIAVGDLRALGDDESLGGSAEDDGGFAEIQRSPHLRLIAAVLFLSVVASQIVDLQFNWAIERETETLGERTALFGSLFSVMGLASFLFQLVLTGRIHRTLGVGFAMRVLPTFSLVLSVAVLAAGYGFEPLLILLIAGLRVGENGLRYSLDHATRELLFVPVPPDQRVRAKGYIDVLVHRFAKGAGALLLLPVTFGLMRPLDTAWLTVALCVGWLMLTSEAKERYVAALRSGLSDGRRRPGGDLALDLGDVNTLEVLVESLGSPEPEQVLGSIDLLERNHRERLVPPLLLYHDDPQVRLRTLGVLERAGRRDALPLIEKRIADADGEVRAAAVRAFATLSNVSVADLMGERLRDPDPRVRAAAVACLAADGEEGSLRLAEAALEQLMGDDDPQVRAEAATALSQVPEPRLQQRLVRLLYDADSRVVRSAIGAVRHRAERDGMNPLFGPILISLLRDRRLKHDAREALVSLGHRVIPSLSHFLREPGEQIWVRRALPKTLARFGGREAVDALLVSLDDAADPMLRRKVIEALVRCEGARLEDPRVHRVAIEECRRYGRALIHLLALGARSDYDLRGSTWRWLVAQPSLLQRLLDERRLDHLRNVLSLLVLGPDRPGMERAREHLLGADPPQRLRAVEFLDNVLPESLRPAVMAVIDDMPVGERVERLRRLFELQPLDRQRALVELLGDPEAGDESSSWIVAATLEEVSRSRHRDLYPRLQELAADSADELVRETAQWAAARVSGSRLAEAHGRF
ncbi:MAG TPA: Npt1/Npt2 family nucleotide transporter [Thermoanaerobaculia bacterium]|nr:Npt1/Npt2 family nucleotide transporter [Thermoanaerobaculia bacterium]